MNCLRTEKFSTDNDRILVSQWNIPILRNCSFKVENSGGNLILTLMSINLSRTWIDEPSNRLVLPTE